MSPPLFSGRYADDAEFNAAEDSVVLPQQFDTGRRTSVSGECTPQYQPGARRARQPFAAEPIAEDGQLQGSNEPSDADAGLSAEQGRDGTANRTRDSEAGKCVSDANEAHLVDSLRQLFLFRDLSDESLRDLTHSLVYRTAAAGTVIIQQADEADYFYVVEKGEVEYSIDGQSVGSSGPGSCFGELALLYNSPRAATVTASTDVELWALDRMTFKSITVWRLSDKRNHSREVLSQVDILRFLSAQAQLKIVDALQPVTYSPGSVVIHEGDRGDYFYVIDEGTAEVSIGGKPVSTLKPGDYFGELALINDSPRKATITAKSSALKLERLDKPGFERLFGPEAVSELRRRDPSLSTEHNGAPAIPAV